MGRAVYYRRYFAARGGLISHGYDFDEHIDSAGD
jgi:hypothetical protein